MHDNYKVNNVSRFLGKTYDFYEQLNLLMTVVFSFYFINVTVTVVNVLISWCDIIHSLFVLV